MHGNFRTEHHKHKMKMCALLVNSGASNMDIAKKLQISYEAAQRLVHTCKSEGLAARKVGKGLKPSLSDKQITIWLSVAAHEKLLTEAEARGCSIQVLCSRLMANIANDSMVNAVLEE